MQIRAHAVQALGVADEQRAVRFEVRGNACDDLAFGLSAEIDHHVAQEDHVETADARKRSANPS